MVSESTVLPLVNSSLPVCSAQTFASHASIQLIARYSTNCFVASMVCLQCPAALNTIDLAGVRCVVGPLAKYHADSIFDMLQALFLLNLHLH